MEPQVGIIMGSKSDWPTVSYAAKFLEKLGICFEAKIVSAHRTPDLLTKYAKSAKSRGIKVIIAAAGGSAHLPGMTAANTILPVLGVPIQSKTFNGLDSLMSIVQMPSGIPVGTLAVGKAGAENAAILAAQILSLTDIKIEQAIVQFRQEQTDKVLRAEELSVTECV